MKSKLSFAICRTHTLGVELTFLFQSIWKFPFHYSYIPRAYRIEWQFILGLPLAFHSFSSFCFDIVYQLELRRHICCVRLFVSVCFDKNSFWYFTLCNADVVDGESEYHKRKRAHMANKADNHGMCQIRTQFIIFFWVIYLERDKYKNNHQKWIRKFFRQSSFSLQSLR